MYLMQDIWISREFFLSLYRLNKEVIKMEETLMVFTTFIDGCGIKLSFVKSNGEKVFTTVITEDEAQLLKEKLEFYGI